MPIHILEPELYQGLVRPVRSCAIMELSALRKSLCGWGMVGSRNPSSSASPALATCSAGFLDPLLFSSYSAGLVGENSPRSSVHALL